MEKYYVSVTTGVFSYPPTLAQARKDFREARRLGLEPVIYRERDNAKICPWGVEFSRKSRCCADGPESGGLCRNRDR